MPTNVLLFTTVNNGSYLAVGYRSCPTSTLCDVADPWQSLVATLLYDLHVSHLVSE